MNREAASGYWKPGYRSRDCFPIFLHDSRRGAPLLPMTRSLNATRLANNPGVLPMAQLTLRTLLAYIDDTLEPAMARQLGAKVAESDLAQELIEKIKRV